MDRVTQYINKVLVKYTEMQDRWETTASVRNYSETISNKMKLDIFINRPIEEQAIIQMDNARKERFQQLLEVQDTLRRVKRYDARNMSLVQFIKMKAGL
tara:strand:+ start:1195 stop:1491 length:297 start_codon:yes stop_codon:yes gene_type:complete